MPIRAIIYFLVLIIFVAFIFRNELYDIIMNLSKSNKHSDDDNDNNKTR